MLMGHYLDATKRVSSLVAWVLCSKIFELLV